ncbi:beta-defensin 115 [Hippopotamus amphibius kiboko]|uniref:beta-defensin 115 n=1 Tax=Hippopotamus amphibius kiboko TaxID=575201 RepID=UPI00259943F1|nr:beta-defensin 115 [Hippopotamus amphibius kiboko]
MLLEHSSPLSRYIKLLFLALAILVVLTQASPDGWARKCGYGTGRCRKHCKEHEKKKEKCGLRKLCCIPVRHRSSEPAKKEEMAYRAMASTTKYRIKTCDKRILAVIVFPFDEKLLLANQTYASLYATPEEFFDPP